MNYKWNDRLVRECRNREIIPFGHMGAWAKRAIRDNFLTGYVEVYSSMGWIPVCGRNRDRVLVVIDSHDLAGPRSDKAYRIIPGWNPMEKKGGAK